MDAHLKIVFPVEWTLSAKEVPRNGSSWGKIVSIFTHAGSVGKETCPGAGEYLIPCGQPVPKARLQRSVPLALQRFCVDALTVLTY